MGNESSSNSSSHSVYESPSNYHSPNNSRLTQKTHFEPMTMESVRRNASSVEGSLDRFVKSELSRSSNSSSNSTSSSTSNSVPRNDSPFETIHTTREMSNNKSSNTLKVPQVEYGKKKSKSNTIPAEKKSVSACTTTTTGQKIAVQTKNSIPKPTQQKHEPEFVTVTPIISASTISKSLVDPIKDAGFSLLYDQIKEISENFREEITGSRSTELEQRVHSVISEFLPAKTATELKVLNDLVITNIIGSQKIIQQQADAYNKCGDDETTALKKAIANEYLRLSNMH